MLPASPGQVGGVEVSFSFASEEDLKQVLLRGVKAGWKPPQRGIDLCSILLDECQNEAEREPLVDSNGLEWKIAIEMSQLQVPLDSIAIPTAREPSYKYCFVRYQLFKAGKN